MSIVTEPRTTSSPGEIQCGGCGQPIDADTTAYRVTVYARRKLGRHWYDNMPTPGLVCPHCWQTGKYHLIGRGEWKTVTADRTPSPCEGCRRLVVLGADPTRTRTYCSPPCKTAAIRRRKRDTSAYSSCEVCGTTMTGARSDRRTCSPACRQRAYRQRQNTTGTASRDANGGAA